MSVKFNLINHSKPDSLFNYGMQVLVYSEEKYKNSGIGWHRDGRDIAYFQNNFKRVSLFLLNLARILLEGVCTTIH